MATINELKARLQRERNLLAAEQEIEKIGSERERLEREIAMTRRERKYGGWIKAGKTIGSGLVKGTKAIQNYTESRQPRVRKTKTSYAKPKSRKTASRESYNPLYDEFNLGI